MSFQSRSRLSPSELHVSSETLPLASKNLLCYHFTLEPVLVLSVSLLFLALFSGPTILSVEIRNSEVWLIRDGVAAQLTNDSKAKLQAELSPREDRIAYYEQCPQPENCIPSVIVIDLDGRRVTSFHVALSQASGPEPCMSILSIAWISEGEIASDCHLNPSLSEYVVIDLKSGRTTRDLFGFSFTLSPDCKSVAHVGSMPHFSPPIAKSFYLQIENVLIYPLPAGKGPFALKDSDERPNLVRNEELKFFDIHEFMSNLLWSPDSDKIAFIDCVFDWTAKDYDFQRGDESNRACSLAAVSHDGKVQKFPLTGISEQDLYQSRISWNSWHELSLKTKSFNKTFQLP